MSSAPDFVARRARVVLLVLTVGVIAFFAITSGSDGSDGSDEVSTAGTGDTTSVASSAGPTSSAPPAVETTAASGTVSLAPTTTVAVVPSTAAATDALAFRKPLNGTVNVTLKWDCYDCVDWPTLRKKHHPAVDYLASDTNIVAAADGVVVKMNTGCGGQGCGNSFGNWLFLRHTLTDGSTLYSFYAHMAEMTPAVTEDACIKSGQKVGVIGNTGIASAAHLHFAIQTNTNLLDYTSASSATVGSVDPETVYGKIKVKSC
jgi:murein DD-endopeptidase MepM/ murein hydrolase activator NlpD